MMGRERVVDAQHQAQRIAMTTDTPQERTGKLVTVLVTTPKGGVLLTLTMMDEDQTVLMEALISLGVQAGWTVTTKMETTDAGTMMILRMITKAGAGSLPSRPPRPPQIPASPPRRHPLWGNHPLLFQLLHPLWTKRTARLLREPTPWQARQQMRAPR